MSKFGLKTVFSKLFASVMMTLVLFAIAMIALTHLVHDNSANTRWQVLAKQIVNQIDPFVDELDNAVTSQERLQARFMLAVVKKSFDIFDESLDAKMGLYDREGTLLIQTDDSDLPKTLPDEPSWLSRMMPSLSSSPAHSSVQAVSDRGYVLLYEPRNPPQRSELSAVLNLFTGTLLLLIIMTIVLWWIARSMTWRINQMSRQMAQLGEGDFSVRVPARGTDEIASLAKGFNQAAQKIEQLINANSLLLAHASHEFRTPITRIRLQIEMMEMLSEELQEGNKNKFLKRAQAIKQDLTGLNDLVESILLVSRLDAGHAAEKNERVNLYELTQQECQHYPEASFYGNAIYVEGQPKLLVHVIRNLLNNATIHGQPPIEVHLYGVMDERDALTPPEEILNLISPTAADVSIITEKMTAETDDTNANLEATINLPSATSIQSEALTQDPVATTHVTSEPQTPKTPSDDTGLTDADSRSELAVSELAASELTDNGLVLPTKDGKSKKAEKTDQTDKSDKPSDAGFTKRLRRNKPEKAKPKPIPHYAVLSVIDQGKGIPLDKRQEIFSPFVRLQQKKKGSGLGLSLVAQIVEAHHGRIRTDVYQGRTRFIVILPTSSKYALEDHTS